MVTYMHTILCVVSMKFRYFQQTSLFDSSIWWPVNQRYRFVVARRNTKEFWQFWETYNNIFVVIVMIVSLLSRVL